MVPCRGHVPISKLSTYKGEYCEQCSIPYLLIPNLHPPGMNGTTGSGGETEGEPRPPICFPLGFADAATGATQNYQRDRAREPRQTLMQSTSSSSLRAEPAAATAATDARSTGRTATSATAISVEWVACDLPAWSCRNCQRMLSRQRNDIPKDSRPAAKATMGASTGSATGGERSAASTSARANADVSASGVIIDAPLHRPAAPNTHRANLQKNTDRDIVDDDASDSSTDDVDSVKDDPDWEDTSSTHNTVTTARHSPVHGADLAMSESEASTSSDSGDEDYRPSTAHYKRRKEWGRSKGKAVKRSRRG